MELSDSRNREKRKLPNFMYGATFPKDTIGSGGPTYGGALDWLKKHQEHLNQSLRYVQRYPNLLQEKVMDNFWDFLEPLIYNNDLLTTYDEFLKTQFGYKENYQLEDKFGQLLPTPATYFRTDIDTRRRDYTYPLRRAFFCYDRTSAQHQTLKHLIVNQLEPFLSVRTNPSADQVKAVHSLDICRAICGGVFILLLSDNILQDQICLNLLSIAIAYKSPIIFLRESGYALPEPIQDCKIVYVKMPENAPFDPRHTTMSADNAASKKRTSYSRGQRKVSNDVEQRASEQEEVEEDVGMGLLKIKEAEAKARQNETELSVSLAAKILDLFDSALIFNPNMYETTLTSLYAKVAALTGATFPSTAPQQAVEEAALLSRPFNLGTMSLPQRQIHRVGTARTTHGFHTLQQHSTQFHPLTADEREQLLSKLNNNNNNTDGSSTPDNKDTADATPKDLIQWNVAKAEKEEMLISTKQTSQQLQTECNNIEGSLQSLGFLNDKAMNELQAFRMAEPQGYGNTKPDSDVLMIPSPPKVMRTGNLQGQLIHPHRTNGFRPNYNPPNSGKLLRYRVGSSRPSSARSRVLLQASLQQNPTELEMP